MSGTYYEDVEVGERRAFGDHEVTKAEIIEFAEQYDPQPFHTDEEAAGESMFGGLVASGWHTAAIAMRLIVENEPPDSRRAGAVGIDELRWRRPVRPGDRLRARTEVLDKEPWDDGLGLVRVRTEVLNDADEVVLSMVGLVLYEMREG